MLLLFLLKAAVSVLCYHVWYYCFNLVVLCKALWSVSGCYKMCYTNKIELELELDGVRV